MKRFLEEAKRLIRIRSVSSEGNEEVANAVSTLMQERGLKTLIQHVMHSNEQISKRQFNVIGILGDPLVDRKIRKGLLLSAHLDTGTPGLPEHWSETGGDPYAATLREGRIYGLGAADAKLDFLCKLHAMERFREKKLKNPIYLVGSCGEELGMLGVKYLIKSHALNPKCVLVGEPTDLALSHAHKCLLIYRVSIGYQMIERDARGFNRRIDLHSFGRTAHGSCPHLGANAILAAVQFLHRAMAQGFQMRFTRVEGGDLVNKVPDHALVQFYLTSHQFEDFKRFFRETMKATGNPKAFRVELGGSGDAGVRFLPDPLLPCVTEVVEAFRGMALELEKQQEVEFDPSCSTVNFGQVKQGMGHLELSFDLRLLPSQSVEEMEQKIKSAIQHIAARYPSLNVTGVRERVNPSLQMSPDDEFSKQCAESLREVGLEPRFSKKSSSTEAAQYAQAGYPSLTFGPGVFAGNSHSPNEWNALEQFEKSVQFYEKIIEKVCL